MIDVVLLAVGKVKDKHLAAAIADYQQRLRPFGRLKVLELKAEPFDEKNRERAKAAEGQRLAEQLAKYERQQVWLLAEDGQQLDSLAWSAWLAAAPQTVVLALAGSLGWSPELLALYPQRLSLGRLTMPHELARLVLMEQLYRAAAIEAGKTYHY